MTALTFPRAGSNKTELDAAIAPQLFMVPIKADRKKLKLLASLVALFLVGGIVGAIGFKHLGFAASLALAAILLALAIVPVLDDLKTSVTQT